MHACIQTRYNNHIYSPVYNTKQITFSRFILSSVIFIVAYTRAASSYENSYNEQNNKYISVSIV